ncbi:hypothetical protein Hamer_G027265 [Homarus americanus]|uniref:Uncharacterized protein n=1 Tax=Homarus americanus TaxID=6706 RepID=A0A8J5MK04_HOMAM|nr:hypothetical protein Hamer_G027265 [Homarus americanus]
MMGSMGAGGIKSIRDKAAKGVIFHTEIQHLELQEIQELIGNIYVERKFMKEHGESTSALVGFFHKLSETVTLGEDAVPVKHYIPRPMRFYNCQRYGHADQK